MNINIGRMKIWDWGVVGAFVLTIIGVSVPWWAVSLGGGNLSGWNVGAGQAAFSFALFAFLWVGAKAFLPSDRPLPKWYAEAWPVLVFGGILVICGIVGTANKPGPGSIGDMWSWRPGGLIALIAALGVCACGYFMLKDKTGDYGQSEMPKMSVNVIKADGTTTQVGGGTSPGAGGKFCEGCGKQLDAGAAFCKGCGRPV